VLPSLGRSRFIRKLVSFLDLLLFVIKDFFSFALRGRQREVYPSDFALHRDWLRVRVCLVPLCFFCQIALLESLGRVFSLRVLAVVLPFSVLKTCLFFQFFQSRGCRDFFLPRALDSEKVLYFIGFDLCCTSCFPPRVSFLFPCLFARETRPLAPWFACDVAPART